MAVFTAATGCRPGGSRLRVSFGSVR